MTLAGGLSLLGPTGLLLIILFIISLHISIRTTIYLSLVGREFKLLFKQAECEGETCLSYVLLGKRNPLFGIIGDVLKAHMYNSNMDIRAEVNYLFHRNFEQIVKKISYLRLISVISPLLGLLGTMLGMVKVFQTIATESAPDSALLASGIWEALLTTILGLCVAIPTLAFYYNIKLRFKGFYIEAVEHSFRAVDACRGIDMSSIERK
ncbi:MAG: MotA/TolQ/ExbB proton channel family protein [Desulfovibrionaceae bacterium]